MTTPGSGVRSNAGARASLEGRAGDARLREGRAHDREGRVGEAMNAYEAAIAEAEAAGCPTVLAEALRRLSILRHRQGAGNVARALCARSHHVAAQCGNAALAAEALNSTAVFDLEDGAIDLARQRFTQALEFATPSSSLRGHIAQNLGIVANIRGDHGAALAHYRNSLEAFELAGDRRGCGIAHNNLGMIAADRRAWDEAAHHFEQCLELAEAIGDVHLRGLAHLNRIEVLLARRDFDGALSSASEALSIFDQLGDVRHKADVYTFLGILYRESGRPGLAETRLRQAIDFASGAGYVLAEAEASRELARLYQEQERNQDALRLLNEAHRLFSRLDARVDMVDVAAKTDELESTYLEVVRAWGRSIESADSYTHGHCERVAEYAVAVAVALGLGDEELITIRLGAYLHDLGKVRVPIEVLNKQGRLSDEELEAMRMHPVYGVEMLEGIGFPWDILPMIRWHHEKYDGSGYPDRLRGDEIPLHAQVICIADVYDALTTSRSYRPAMTHEEALTVMAASPGQWRPDVYRAFIRSVRRNGAADASAPGDMAA